ncbi:MAG: circularly permuted type 2 ATP-grasp protein, partial [Planctomycetaceae bacterium]
MSTSSTNQNIFDSYAASSAAFDEVHDDTTIRDHWRQFVDVINGEKVEELNERRSIAQDLLTEHGVTLKVFDDKEAADRPWDMDLLPYIVGQDDWKTITEGLDQRARLLDLIVRDLYGPQQLLKSGEIPPEVLFANPRYIRAFQNLIPHDKVWLHYCGAELARGPNGHWWVMADRTDVADGAGYALEHRLVAARSMPKLIRRLNVKRLAPYFDKLRSSFESMAPRATEAPRVVLLSPGPSHPGYFEDQFLARYLGFILAEGGDLAVRNDHVGLKTLDGLLPIDVIFRRYPESMADPVELGGSSPQGIPGLLQAVRAGNVAMVNTPGTRLVETPVFMAFLPKLCQVLLSEDLKIPSIATWWCGNESKRKFVLDNFDRLVIKPSFSSSGGDEFVVSELSQDERKSLRERVIAKPGEFVAQEKIVRSAAPVWKSDHIESGHIALRTFATRTGDKYRCMPGALVRVA